MQKTLVLLLAFFTVVSAFAGKTDAGLSDLLRELDKTIAERNNYDIIKEKWILELKQQLNNPELTLEQQYEINKNLYRAYDTYMEDSVYCYIQNNLTIAQNLHRTDWINEGNISLSIFFRTVGMYKESINILQNMDASDLDNSLKITYYDACKQVFRYDSYHPVFEQKYKQISSAYRDSMLRILDSTSFHYQIIYAEKLTEQNHLDEAKRILFDLLQNTTEMGRGYAVITHSIANVFRQENNSEQQNKYYALSAIADIQNSVKENASLQLLAIALYQAGDIKRAYRYIACSLEDAICCNAQMRTNQIAQIYPIIDSDYQQRTLKEKRVLILFLSVMAFLTLLLVIAVSYVYKQMKRLNKAKKEISIANRQLKEANQIKEEYLGHFLNSNSNYIEKMENYRKTLKRKFSDKNFDELLRLLNSKILFDTELSEFHQNFDHSFLHIFPTFVEDFNGLLFPDKRFVLKEGELLNIEIRIFALIRLGITESSMIAAFLRYSNQTIYNYRSKVKSASPIPRDDFEKKVMEIGVL
jgi:hypothetical protein